MTTTDLAGNPIAGFSVDNDRYTVGLNNDGEVEIVIPTAAIDAEQDKYPNQRNETFSVYLSELDLELLQEVMPCRAEVDTLLAATVDVLKVCNTLDRRQKYYQLVYKQVEEFASITEAIRRVRMGE